MEEIRCGRWSLCEAFVGTPSREELIMDYTCTSEHR